MTTQDIERPRKVAYAIECDSGSSLRIYADDPEDAGRMAMFHVGSAFTSRHGFGTGPVFTSEVVQATSA